MVLISLTVYRNSQISSVIRRWPDSRCCFRGDKLGYLVVAKHCHHFGSCVNTISNNGSRFLYQRGNCIGCCFFQRISKQILAQVQFCGCWLFFLFRIEMEVHFYVWFYTDLYIKYRFNCKLKTKGSFLKNVSFTIAGGITARWTSLIGFWRRMTLIQAYLGNTRRSILATSVWPPPSLLMEM